MTNLQRAPRIGETQRMEKPPLHPTRQRIWRAREWALSKSCELRSLDGGEVAFVASGFAARWMFNRQASQDDLECALSILRWLLLAAGAIERLEGGA